MYIKIKYIKRFSLIALCTFFLGVNYLAFVKADNNSADMTSQTTSSDVSTGSMTADFAQSLQDYVNSKGSQSISSADIQNFSSTLFADKETPITYDSLPNIDQSKIKILKQPYDGLSDSEKKAKLQADANAYIDKVFYLLISNVPTPIQNKDDLVAFGQDLTNHLASLSTGDPDLVYFSKLATGLDQFLVQVNDIEVPESMLDIHIKFLRIISGVLTLRNENYSAQDPMSQVLVMGKIQGYAKLISDFFQTDISNYINQISN